LYWHGNAVTSSTLLADPPSNETIDVFYINTVMDITLDLI